MLRCASIRRPGFTLIELPAVIAIVLGLVMVRRPGQTYVFVEAYDRRQIGNGVNPGPLNGYRGLNASGRWGDCPPIWHDGGANFSFLDGHAEYRKWVGPKMRTGNIDGWAFTANYWPGTPLDAEDYQWMRNGLTNGFIR